MLARRPPPADGLVLMPMRMGRSEEYAGLAALVAREVAFAYLGYLRRDHDLAVRLVGIAFKVILMVALGSVEPVQRLELGAERTACRRPGRLRRGRCGHYTPPRRAAAAHARR